MPRYDFIVTYADKELGIPGGSILPGDKAAFPPPWSVNERIAANIA